MATPTPTRVVLLGLMGCGKSTVGKQLAERTGWPHLDNDARLRDATGKTLTEVAELGVDKLHEAEREVLRRVLDMPPPFVAGAAAAVLDDDPEIGELLHKRAFPVYLHVPPETLVNRIGDDVNRPWLKPDPAAALRRMCEMRDPLYRKVAAYVVDGTQTPEQIADEVYAQLPRPM
jgi:shikimate kinase